MMNDSSLFTYRFLLLRVSLLFVILSFLITCGNDRGGNAKGNATLSVSPTTLTFNAGANTQSLAIRNTGGGTLTWSITADQSWLSLGANVTNQTTTTETDRINVTVNRTGLSAGDYQGTLTVTSNGGNLDIDVTMVASSEPQVSITSPAANARFTPTDIIRFSGSATDLEDGVIPDTALIWTSNLPQQTPLQLGAGTGSSVTSTLPVGTHTITLTATDSSNLTGTATVTVVVSIGGGGGGSPVTNNIPRITSIAPTTAVLNQPFSYALQANDLDGDILTYTLSGNPTGMTINSRTGVISWTPTALGRQNITVSVRDGRNGVATQSFVLLIVNSDNTAPTNDTETGFINNNATQTGSNSVILSLLATDNVAVTAYMVKDSSSTLAPTTPIATAPGWLTVPSSPTYKATVAYLFSTNYPVETQVSVYVWFKDAAGNVSRAVTDSISRATLTTPFNATPEDFIDFGAAQTNARKVLLSLAATDDVGITGYFIADNSSGTPPATPTANAPTWKTVASLTAYVANVNYTFSSVYTNGSTATVYVWFKDADGLLSQLARDSIRVAGGGSFPPGPGPGGSIFNESFETGLSAWLIDDGVWGLLMSDLNSQQCFSGSQCLATITAYSNPNRRESHIASPAIRLPELTELDHENKSEIVLSFWQKANFSATNGGRVLITSELEPVITSEGSTVFEIDARTPILFDKSSIGTNSEKQSWFQSFIDLSSFAGDSIRVHFVFMHNINKDSGDDDDVDDDDIFDQNNQPFWSIDEVRISPSIPVDSKNKD